MTTQSDSSLCDPQEIGNAFVKQFYTVFHNDPTQAYRFYQDLSTLSRPCPDGTMKSVTTVKDINELILSLGYQSYKAEISVADAQFSSANGVFVLVIGILIGKDNLRRKFTQSFFLAPQEGGYYVLDDVFRYLDDEEPMGVANNDVDESTHDAFPPDPVASHTITPSDNGDNSDKEVTHPLDNDKTAYPRNQDYAPKKSYLAVVNALSKNSAPFILRAPPPKAKRVEQSRRAAAPEAAAPKSNKGVERNNDFSGKNTSIFVANLPMNATEELLSEVFTKFGAIKPNGIQVRSFKDNKNCFGFVEFESATSMQSAVMASPIIIGNRQANIEEKQGANNGWKPGRAGNRDENGYRSNNFRGRESFNGGRNFGKNKRTDISLRSNSRQYWAKWRFEQENLSKWGAKICRLP
ncbi:hypothetical protein DITRI_Ditri12bG0010300 [Diplodiscus trichospermus]